MELKLVGKQKELFTEKYRNKIASTVGRIDKTGQPILFKLSFEEFVDLYVQQGVPPVFPYVISRINDLGHYEIGNVFVSTNTINSAEGSKELSVEDKIKLVWGQAKGYKQRVVRGFIRRGEITLEQMRQDVLDYEKADPNKVLLRLINQIKEAGIDDNKTK